jgi:hypothetical protein
MHYGRRFCWIQDGIPYCEDYDKNILALPFYPTQWFFFGGTVSKHFDMRSLKFVVSFHALLLLDRDV